MVVPYYLMQIALLVKLTEQLKTPTSLLLIFDVTLNLRNTLNWNIQERQ